jgi:hypothetical protein
LAASRRPTGEIGPNRSSETLLRASWSGFWALWDGGGTVGQGHRPGQNRPYSPPAAGRLRGWLGRRWDGFSARWDGGRTVGETYCPRQNGPSTCGLRRCWDGFPQIGETPECLRPQSAHVPLTCNQGRSTAAGQLRAALRAVLGSLPHKLPLLKLMTLLLSTQVQSDTRMDLSGRPCDPSSIWSIDSHHLSDETDARTLLLLLKHHATHGFANTWTTRSKICHRIVRTKHKIISVPNRVALI